jgi:SAM-dependent methyltransferase
LKGNALDPKRIVAEGYDQMAERHALWAIHTRTEERARYADLLLSALPFGAAVLELGCGAGMPITKKLAARFRVTAVDLSERQVQLAHVNVPDACILHGDMTRVEFPSASFDAVAAFYSIIHVPREEQAALFVKVVTWLRPGGVFVGSLGTQDRETDYEADWLGAPMYWSGYAPDMTRRLIESAGLVIQRADIETADEDGMPVSFLCVVARRP